MLNQSQFGAPQGGGNFLAPVQGAVDKFFDRKRAASGDLRKMVVGHELQSIRDEKKYAHERGKQESSQAHALTLQERGIAHAQKEGRASRTHEKGMKRLDIAGEVMKTNTSFAGIAALGKGKRVSNFSMDGQGGMQVNFNKPTTRRRSSTTPGQPTVVEPTTPQRSTTAPEVPAGEATKIASVVRDPKTGRAMRNPALGAPAAKKTPAPSRKKK